MRRIRVARFWTVALLASGLTGLPAFVRSDDKGGEKPDDAAAGKAEAKKRAERAPEADDAAKQGLAEAQEALGDAEHAALAALVLKKLDGGLKGEALAKAIRERLEALRKERAAKREAKKEDAKKAVEKKKGPGEALDHGLCERDLCGLGRFVAERLTDGTRGQELADVIRKEVKERQEERKKAREEDADARAAEAAGRAGEAAERAIGEGRLPPRVNPDGAGRPSLPPRVPGGIPGGRR